MSQHDIGEKEHTRKQAGVEADEVGDKSVAYQSRVSNKKGAPVRGTLSIVMTIA
jgi:hypothetical protein